MLRAAHATQRSKRSHGTAAGISKGDESDYVGVLGHNDLRQKKAQDVNIVTYSAALRARLGRTATGTNRGTRSYQGLRPVPADATSLSHRDGDGSDLRLAPVWRLVVQMAAF